MAAVSDSSPLIALEQIGQLELLRDLFDDLLIPGAVLRETAASIRARPWIRLTTLKGPLHPEVLRPSLGRGEREAISLAVEVTARALLVDDESARRVAVRLAIPVMGTAGVLLAAKVRRLIPQVKPLLDTLLSKGFFLSVQVKERILAKAGEL
jgi:hypothetical protein